jgi:Dcp1-like decapping family
VRTPIPSTTPGTSTIAMSTRRNSRRQASVDFPRHPPQSSQNHLQPRQQTPQISDYESDNAFAYLSDHPLPAQHQVSPRTIDELNLSVLQRYNPAIISILSVAPYAVIYTFSPSPEPEWIKSGVEGSLFICQLEPGQLGEDRFNAIVLNRRGLENFEAELKEDETGGVELTDEYIIVTSNVSGQPTASGIWVFSEGPGSSTAIIRDLVAQFVKERAVQAGQSRRAAEEAQRQGNWNGNGNRNGHSGQQPENGFGVPIGRQISLQEMFGQQRKDDDEWSVKMHSPEGGQAPPFPVRASRQEQQGLQPLFQRQQQQQDPSENHLRDLFMKAGLSR